MMIMKSMQGHLLAAAMWNVCLCGICTALSRINSGYRKSVSINHIRIAALRSHPYTDDSMICNPLRRFRSVDYLMLNDDAGTDIHKTTYTKSKIEGATAKLFHSIALATSCRRISFLMISIVLTNFVRSTILKASTSCFVYFSANFFSYQLTSYFLPNLPTRLCT